MTDERKPDSPLRSPPAPDETAGDTPLLEPEAAATGNAGKDERARLEKFAQAHLDRAQTVRAGATKTALAWSVALALIWFQVLEPRLTRVRNAQAAQVSLGAIARSDIQEIGPDRLLQRVDIGGEKVTRDESAAADQTIELPFSIKLTLHPYWVSTFWLTLALFLILYMQDARGRIFRLAALGVRLQCEAGVDDPRVRTLVGGGIWWLAPISGRVGPTPCADSDNAVFGWREGNWNTAAAACAALMLFLLQLRVQYVSFCVAAGLLAIDAGRPTAFWLGIPVLNLAMGSMMVILIGKWFFGTPIKGSDGKTVRNGAITRRLVFKLVVIGAAGNLAAICAFSAARLGKLRSVLVRRVKFTKRERHHKRRTYALEPGRPLLSTGLYLNPKTGTVHVSAPANGTAPFCWWCIRSRWAGRLVPIEYPAVSWNHLKPAPTFIRPASSPVPDPSQNKVTPHPHMAHRTFMLEQQALALVTANNPSAAIELLREASRGVSVFGLRPGVRLYDLLAGLAVRYGSQDVLKELVQNLQGELIKAEQLQNRLRSSQPSVSAWLRLILIAAEVATPWQYQPATSRRRRSNRPRHHETGHPPVKKATTLPNTDRDLYLTNSLHARIDKWSRPESSWAGYWGSQAPIKWAKLTLPPRATKTNAHPPRKP